MDDIKDIKETTAQRLAEVRKAKDERAKASAEAKALAEIDRFDLEVRFEKELNGKIGRQFEIVDLTEYGDGFIVLKLGESILFRQFQDSKMNEVDRENFVLPNVVYPSKEDYRKIVSLRAFTATRCTNALSSLYGANLEIEAGKF